MSAVHCSWPIWQQFVVPVSASRTRYQPELVPQKHPLRVLLEVLLWAQLEPAPQEDPLWVLPWAHLEAPPRELSEILPRVLAPEMMPSHHTSPQSKIRLRSPCRNSRVHRRRPRRRRHRWRGKCCCNRCSSGSLGKERQAAGKPTTEPATGPSRVMGLSWAIGPHKLGRCQPHTQRCPHSPHPPLRMRRHRITHSSRSRRPHRVGIFRHPGAPPLCRCPRRHRLEVQTSSMVCLMGNPSRRRRRSPVTVRAQLQKNLLASNTQLPGTRPSEEVPCDARHEAAELLTMQRSEDASW